MALFSKPAAAAAAAQSLWTKQLHYSCYELGHTWTPSCRQAVLGVFWNSAAMSWKMYATLYLVMALARRKKFKYFLKQFWVDTARSTMFLSVNAGGFIMAFCVWRRFFSAYFFHSTAICAVPLCFLCLCIEATRRHILGHFNIASIFVAPLAASLAAIFIERTPRRSMLALYVTNLAMETAFRMLTAHGIVQPVKYGEVGIFALAMAGYLYLFKKQNGLDSSSAAAIRALFGSSEHYRQELDESHMPGLVVSPDSGHIAAPVRVPRAILSSVVAAWHRAQTYAGHTLGQLLTACHAQGKHRLCRHSNGCAYVALASIARGSSIGFLIQAAFRLIRVLGQIRNPVKLLKMGLFHKENVQCGAFLGSMCVIYQVVCCLLRRVTNKDSEIHGLVAGFLAGLGMVFYRSSALAVAILLRFITVLFNKSVENGLLPELRHGPIIVYATSTALLIHAAIFEPHNIRPAYWAFLLKLTGGRFAEMNRKLMEPFGCDSSKLFGDWWPQYDSRYTTLSSPDWGTA